MAEGTGSGGKRIAAAFAAARDERHAALMPYMMGGFPTHADSLAIARAYVDGGADLIELGVPFSDPLADGPVIHDAATQALRAGAELDSVLEICASVADAVPVVLMAYANMLITRGPPEFARAAAVAGAAGVIVPDLSLEEAAPIRSALDAEEIALVPLLAPTTPPERRRRISELARGFVYLVSDVGVTGERGELPPRLAGLAAEARADSPVPVAVGFGIGTPAQAASVGEVADGVIVGSRLVRAVAEAEDGAAAAAAVGNLLRDCHRAMTGEPVG